MSETRREPVVCHCHRCSRLQFRKRDGNWASGAIVSSATKISHAAVDTQMVARFQTSRDSDDDEDEDEDDDDDSPQSPKKINHSESPHVRRLNNDIEQIHLSSRHPGPNRSEVYDCSRFYKFTLKNVDPAVLHMSLLAAMLSVFDHVSVATSSWFLKSGKELLTLAASGGLGDRDNDQGLNLLQENTLDALPSDIRTVLARLQIEPTLVTVICCPSCWAMYPKPAPREDDAPETAAQTAQKNAPKIPAAPTGPTRCINKVFPKEDGARVKQLREAPSECGAELYRLKKASWSPIKPYAYQSLYDWLGRLFSRPEIEPALEKIAALAVEPFDPTYEATDIHHSKIWKEFLGPDGTQYTKQPENLTFGMFMDGINPYGKSTKSASIHFIIMVCYSLPLELRYQPQNVFIVGIAPGPKETSLEQINWILRPIVEQLKVLWDTGLTLSQTVLHPRGRRVRAAILPFFADLPALRRGLGFASPMATRMCSYCLLPKQEIKNLKPETWPLRDLEVHRHWAIKSRDAKNLEVRQEILLDHGVRYSVMLELPYWDVLQYHVVDSMHNLLLGLSKWHCQRFWCMADVAEEEEPEKIPKLDVNGMRRDVTHRTLAALVAQSDSDSDNNGVPFNQMEFASTESSDNSFSPFLEAEGWGTGAWIRPTEGKTILDRDALAFINKRLPRIRYPTWVKQPIPVLGKASFGSLKADEWRNLIVIQLPLLLPVYWAAGGPPARSLFRNFAHLVSMVNLALKRLMNIDKAEKYRQHTLAYLESCLLLFPDVDLAPNHHMSIHLADCLAKFGPSRAWWSFSMERLMGRILKAAHNNRLGQLEITFLTNFCRIGNLQAVLSASETYPAQLMPFINQLKAFHDPIHVEAETIPKRRQGSLDSSTLQILVKRLNDLFPCPTGATWLSSDAWAKKRKAEASKFLSVASRIKTLSSCVINEVRFSTYKENPSNSVIVLQPGCAPQYSIIEQIFQHWRTLGNGTSTADIWLVTRPLLPCSFPNPFAGLQDFEVGVELRTFQTDETDTLYINHTQEVLAHCAWIKYRPSEIIRHIKKECIALVSLER
ncbi:hypothetical protein MJO28_005865 [Puccinia striiformis f. sp. tritici]|uniref:Uncharacterized protein n=1 Tax=Puccinia striiformis f. sp. tritici TaxID=168172 RepID=A0ACC0EFS1_9BASI|nr:hypothetical protein MJO28_005865 [Puccinia striiformis f. sp. tritici]